MMSKFELRIPNNTDSGYFDTVVVNEEKKFEMKLSQFFSFSTHLETNIFKNVSELAIFYDDKPVPIPTEIAANLLRYLTGSYKALNIDSKFTCHQFAFLLTTNKPINIVNSNFFSTTQLQLSSGQIIHFVKQGGEFGDGNLKFSHVHSALFLGNGLFLSKNGTAFPGIYTLDVLVELYPCDYITIAKNTVLNGGDIENDSSIYLSFKNKAFVHGLAFKALNISCKYFREISPKQIASSYRKASLQFHPDRTNLPENKAQAFLALTQKMYDFLRDPINRSDYYVSLLAGNDSITRILGFDSGFPSDSEIKTRFEDFIELLKHHGQLTADEERKIKDAPRYKRALSKKDDPVNSDIVIQVSPDIDYLSNQNPYHPTSVVFEGQRKELGDTLHFKMTSDTRVGDLKIHTGTPVIVCFNKHKFNEQSMQSGELREKLPPGLINYADVKNGLKQLESWFSRSGITITLNSKFSKKKHLTQNPNSFIFLINNRAEIHNVAVFLGGNFYLVLMDSKSQNAYIINVAFIQQDKALSAFWLVLDQDMNSTQKYKPRFDKTYTLDFTEAEICARLSHLQTEAFKRYLLSFISEKNYTFVHYLNGFKFTENTVIDYNVNQNESYYYLRAGQSVLVCQGLSVVTQAFYLGNNLFALASTTGYLRIVNLLMLSETVGWDALYILEPITETSKNKYSCQIIAHRKKIELEDIKEPLLYSILGIPFDLTSLSAISEQVVVESYSKRISHETDPEVLKVLNRAYKLLMNDSYRIFYGAEILFGGEPELTAAIFLDIKHTSYSDIVKGYLACLKLINNTELKDRISKEFAFRQSKSELTTDFINNLPQVPLPKKHSAFATGRDRWRSFFNTNEYTHRYKIPSYEAIFSVCPQAHEAFKKLEKQFELQEIDLDRLSFVSTEKLFEYIWHTMEKPPQKSLPKPKEQSRYSLSESSTSPGFFPLPSNQTKEEHSTEKLKQRSKIKLEELGIEAKIDFSF